MNYLSLLGRAGIEKRFCLFAVSFSQRPTSVFNLLESVRLHVWTNPCCRLHPPTWSTSDSISSVFRPDESLSAVRQSPSRVRPTERRELTLTDTRGDETRLTRWLRGRKPECDPIWTISLLSHFSETSCRSESCTNVQMTLQWQLIDKTLEKRFFFKTRCFRKYSAHSVVLKLHQLNKLPCFHQSTLFFHNKKLKSVISKNIHTPELGTGRIFSDTNYTWSLLWQISTSVCTWTVYPVLPHRSSQAPSDLRDLVCLSTDVLSCRWTTWGQRPVQWCLGLSLQATVVLKHEPSPRLRSPALILTEVTVLLGAVRALEMVLYPCSDLCFPHVKKIFPCRLLINTK